MTFSEQRGYSVTAKDFILGLIATALSQIFWRCRMQFMGPRSSVLRRMGSICDHSWGPPVMDTYLVAGIIIQGHFKRALTFIRNGLSS